MKTTETDFTFLGPWEKEVLRIATEGVRDYKRRETIHGFVDGHTHLDRCLTYSADFLPGINIKEVVDLTLEEKQEIVGTLHDGPAYTVKSLRERMERQIRRAIKANTREMWAVVDTTPDIGLRAFEVAQKLKAKYRKKITLYIACYPVFGFKNPLLNPDRLEIIQEAAPRADFIVGLPEKDERDGRVGFKGHTSILLDIAYRHKKELHIHADQGNTAEENGSLRIIECLEGMLPEELAWFTAAGRPKLWLVHVISPSCYPPEKFSRLISLLVKYNIGVIVCAEAAISMRNLRSEYTPTHNSIARVIEMLRYGVKVGFGTDNVNDLFVPSGTGLIVREISALSNITRHYSDILVKVGMGIDPNNSDRAMLSRALHETRKACQRHKVRLPNGKPEIIDF